MKLLYIFIIALALNSCKADCTDPMLKLSLTGFDTSDSKVVIMKTYVKNTNYSTIKDSTVWAISQNVPAGYFYYKSNDTNFTTQDYILGGSLGIGVEYDYIISFPIAHVSFTIDRISSGHTRAVPNGDNGCTSSLTCYVNNAMQSFGSDIEEDNNLDNIKLAK